MAAKKGHKKIGGRQKGTPNKFTRTVKETVLAVFETLQDDPEHCLLAFAKSNQKEFYAIAAKLIPTEITGKDGERLIPLVISVQDAATKREIELLGLPQPKPEQPAIN